METKGKFEFRWGIVGAGLISSDFCTALKLAPGAKIAAVAARSLTKANEFAAKHEIPKAYATYEALARDASIDIVYIGTIHPAHFECARTMLLAGKNVLCEKPMAMNAAETSALVTLAREKRVFCMEGLWTRFFPATIKALALIDQGHIGDVVEVIADFGFASKVSETSRLYNLEMGGGGLLDIGIYVLASAAYIWGGSPSEVRALGWKEPTGADSAGVIALKYGADSAPLLGGSGGGAPTHPRLASLTYSMRTATREVTIYQGTRGKLILWPSHCPTQLTVEVDGSPASTLHFPLPDPPKRAPATSFINSLGFVYQATRVQVLLSQGATECPEWPLQTSLEMARLMDSIRVQLGVVYPRHDGLLARARTLLGIWPLSARILTAALALLLAYARKRGRA
jgi:dihydrodiol dehydrogenase / D-xylose 1-dehydrogenase (NADP)